MPFKCHLCAGDFQINIFRLDFSLWLQIHLSNCLHAIPIWKSRRHLKHRRSQTNLNPPNSHSDQFSPYFTAVNNTIHPVTHEKNKKLS